MWTNPSTQNWSFLGRWKYRGGGRGEPWFFSHLAQDRRAYRSRKVGDGGDVFWSGRVLFSHWQFCLKVRDGGGVFWMLASGLYLAFLSSGILGQISPTPRL